MTDDGARQAPAHDRVQADVGLSYDLCAVCRFPARLFRLEYAPADHRADHPDGRCRDHRSRRAIPPGRPAPAGLRRRCAGPAGRDRASTSSPPARARGSPAMWDRWRPAFSRRSGWTETVYRRHDDPEGAEHHALVRVFQLPGGFRLLVGRDLEERDRLRDIVFSAGRWSLAIVIVLGLAGGLFVTRRVLKRVDAMTETTRKIMDGRFDRPAADRRDRRRARSARRQSQCHARAHRGAHARPQGGLRQHRARSQDAAHQAAQPVRRGAAARRGRIPIPAGAREHDRGIGGADPHLQCTAR